MEIHKYILFIYLGSLEMIYKIIIYAYFWHLMKYLVSPIFIF